MNPIQGNTSSRVAKFVTAMTKHDALAPIVALEAFVVTGRTYQAYKRGKGDEARERFIEESMGSITWLLGVKTLNHIGDKLLVKIFGKNFDVGTDKILRTPFENFMKKNPSPKGLNPTQIALIKSGKVLTSIILANLFIGFVVPKLNQALTVKLRKERKAEMQKQNNQDTFIPESNDSKINTTAFKGGPMGAINGFTNIIENTNTGQLLSSDCGIAGGRMYNARSKEERREIAIRDLGSIYFYMWASGHVGNILNMIESGHSSRLNPTTANILDKYLQEYLDKNNGSIDINKFRTEFLGSKPNDSRINGLNFAKEQQSAISKLFNKQPLEVTTLADFERMFKNDSKLIEKAREMSKLQPLRVGEAVLTKQQVLDTLNMSEINNPKLLDEVFNEFTNGASRDELKYVSNSSLYKLKTEMEQYVENICKSAKNGKVDKKLLETMKKRNLRFNGINFIAGFITSAMFLSTFIPKIQYYVTKKKTGVDAFPGTYDFEHHKEL